MTRNSPLTDFCAQDVLAGDAEHSMDTWAPEIIASAPDGVLLVNLEGIILLTNQAMENISGYSESELVGHPVEILLPAELRARHKESSRRFGSNPVRRPMGMVKDLCLQHKDGTSVAVDIALSQCVAHGATATIVFVRDISGIKLLQKQMQFQATRDALTGMPNRWMLGQHLGHALLQARQNQTQLAVLMIDLDDFKSVKDLHGHSLGDKVLIEASQRIAESVRPCDTVARLSGDEFVVLLNGLSMPTEAVAVADTLGYRLEQPCSVEGQKIRLSGSVGIAIYPDDAKDAETLMRCANMAMFRAKAEGGGRYALYSVSMAARVAERVRIQDRLETAIRTNTLELHYQPQIDVVTGAIVGVEALLRWTDEELGDMPPDRFLSIAEETGLIIPLGNWVLDSACRQAAIWFRAGFPIRVAVNISARQFRQPDLSEQVQRRIREAGLPPHLIELEITESEAMTDPQQTKALLTELSGLGVAVALDDFGTGHSSLAYIRDFPISRLKIDRSFVQPITQRKTDAALVKAILVLAHIMSLEVVAEGVETQSQLEFLRAHGCNYYQGWLFSKAVSAGEISAMLQRSQQLLAV
ncbi:EAL domain-containing protein [Rhodoferax saidenbachensis]|uniref:Diguanylate cyclase (GGDEF)-like protein/PAS domain S-box-containing protein n=1 Tax=Rhodoferax saidenbachensis TaxID=1484693 RepID=A0ABU1ZTW2_9BURK|nr:EAL domain-containing protein [Rhodoferax saidenbachensis]MDR7307966.1 diguanylate cyclase (GGDEF)-like protein/PAS domain S-box-containing protein [Rhodoferax saidenbachensis]